jgi:alpha-beta hydrolase superfamily lysophospholipase
MAAWTRRDWLRRGAKLSLAAGAFYGLFRWFESHTVFQPYARFWAEGSALDRPWEDVYFTTSDGVRLNGWHFPAKPEPPRRPWTVLLCHGNAGNISHRLSLYSALLEAGVSVFAFDYRGYGRSAGRPSERGTYLDAEAAHAWLRQQGVAPSNILAYGDSLGGGVVSELALRQTLGGLVLQSTFTSVTDLGSEVFPWLPVRTLGRIKYDTLGKLPRIAVPVLVMHAKGDQLVPFHHAEKLYAAARQPKLFGDLAGGHNDVLEADRARFIANVTAFLKLAEAGPPTPPSPPLDTGR